MDIYDGSDDSLVRGLHLRQFTKPTIKSPIEAALECFLPKADYILSSNNAHPPHGRSMMTLPYLNYEKWRHVAGIALMVV